MIDEKVLIIDDDADLRHLAGLLFKKAGAHVFTANDGLEGISKLFTCDPSLIILDVTMPGTNGFDVCQRIRQVSASNQEVDMLRGLESGADDYLSKPFTVEVLLARAKTVLRRSASGKSPSSNFEFNNGHLSIDIERGHVLVEEKRVKLTPIEFRLLVYLARNAGKVLTFDDILANIWGDAYRGSIDYVHVYILTVHGVGYMFER
jgi:DNA-binding response OmpR family regulator